MSLKEYQAKRRSGRSPEPGARRRRTRRSASPRFVIQHHVSSTDHYDFRLESQPESVLSGRTVDEVS